MTQREIKNLYKRLREDIDDHQGEIDVLWARIRVNQKKCKHPNLYAYTAMGDPGVKCPDCGHQT